MTSRAPTANDLDEYLTLLARDPAAREHLRAALASEANWVTRPEIAEEVGGPTLALLKDLNLLETDADRFRWWEGTPFSKQAITAGTTSLAKIAAPAVGLPGLLAALVGYFRAWGTSTIADWVLIGCATALLAITALCVALIVRADLDARARTSAAQYRARAMTTAAYLNAAHRPQAQRNELLLALAEPKSGVMAERAIRSPG